MFQTFFPFARFSSVCLFISVSLFLIFCCRVFYLSITSFLWTLYPCFNQSNKLLRKTKYFKSFLTGVMKNVGVGNNHGSAGKYAFFIIFNNYSKVSFVVFKHYHNGFLSINSKSRHEILSFARRI